MRLRRVSVREALRLLRRHEGRCVAAMRGFCKRQLLWLAVLPLLAVFAPPAEAQMREGPGRWVKKASLPIPRTEISVAELDGEMFVAGGYVPGRVTSYLLLEYDTATGK